MTPSDQKLHPGEFFLERRDKSGKWETLSRDNDGEVMNIRYDYAASMLAPGEEVQLIRPDRTVFSQKEFDTAPATT